MQDLLRRSNFPALRALALSHFHEDLLGILRAPSTLQLIEALDASTLITSSIVQAVAWALTLTQPIHLCLRGPPDEDHSGKEEDADYKKLAEIIENSNQSPLLSLYLDVQLRPPFGNTSFMEAGGRLWLVEACEKRKVEVVYEEGPCNWTKDPIISQEFWRRQRELRKAGEKVGRE